MTECESGASLTPGPGLVVSAEHVVVLVEVALPLAEEVQPRGQIVLEYAASGGQPVREPLHLVALNAAEPAAGEKVGRVHAPIAE